MAEKRWISIGEASATYSLHSKTLLRLCRQRQIPHVRMPSARGGKGSIRIDRVAFDRQLEEHEVLPVEGPARIDRRRRT